MTEVSEFPRVTVLGDAVNGWYVEIHDGDKYGTYRPEAANADEAKVKALAEHNGEPPHVSA